MPMKSFCFLVPVVRLAIGALLLASTVHGGASNAIDTSKQGSGRLVVRRSPVLGYNVRVHLTIDGVRVDSLTRNRSLEVSLPPGRHVLAAWSNGVQLEWTEIVNVRPGETHAYTATFNNRVVLTPDPASR